MMQTLNIKNRLKKIIVPFTGLLIFFYFFMFILQSIQAQTLIKKELLGLEKTSKAIFQEKNRLELQVSLLKSEHLDIDYLDERARDTLGLIHPDEIILYGVF